MKTRHNKIPKVFHLRFAVLLLLKIAIKNLIIVLKYSNVQNKYFFSSKMQSSNHLERTFLYTALIKLLAKSVSNLFLNKLTSILPFVRVTLQNFGKALNLYNLLDKS